MKDKKRIDILLMEKGLVTTRSLAQRLIMEGKVLVDGMPISKPSEMVSCRGKLSLLENARYVSRGGEKLESALMNFGLMDLTGFICADVGSSTGGFTDCLLQHGAKKVYSIDVGYGLMHWKLRNHPAVVLMERTNARNVMTLPEKIDLITIDASFISLRTLLNVVRKWFCDEEGQVIALIKPQFEAGKKEAARGKGVIRDPEIHRRILIELLTYAKENGFSIKGLIRSPVVGPKGNIEFLTLLSSSPEQSSIDIPSLVADLVTSTSHASDGN